MKARVNRILVTGPDGFIGMELCKTLLQRGGVVCGAQRKSAPLPDGCESVVVGDIGAGTDWSVALRDVDAVVHLAARVHVMRDVEKDPLAEFWKVNVEGTRRLAESAARGGVKHFVFVSSIKVNGEESGDRGAEVGGGRSGDRHFGGKTAFSELDVPNPQDAYSVSKWEAERVLRDIEARSGMAVTVLRPPLVYGPGVKANFRKLMEAVKKGVPLPLGCVRNLRSFIGVTNLVDIVVNCVGHDKARGKMYVVSDGDDVSTPELIRRMAVALGRKDRLIPVPVSFMCLVGRLLGKSAQVDRLLGSLVIDSSRVCQELNWTPVRSMQSELRRLAETM